MSGGVDSTVVAALLHKAGYDVVGVTLQLYDHGAALKKKGACCAGQDIHDARLAAEMLGIPVPELKSTPPVEIAKPRYNGELAVLGCRQINMRWGGIGIEFIEPDENPSTWRDFLERRGPGIHHIGFRVSDMAAKNEEFHAEGYPTIQEGSFHGGCYAYNNTEPDLGILIELLQFDKTE